VYFGASDEYLSALETADTVFAFVFLFEAIVKVCVCVLFVCVCVCVCVCACVHVPWILAVCSVSTEAWTSRT
jgi:hypothetical protein